jgi:PKD repeat protein
LQSAQALAFVLTALVGAVSCVDGSRLSGPFKPIGGEQVLGLNLAYDSVAPATVKSAPRLRSLGGASSASLLSPRGVRALTSRATDPVTLQATPIEFKPEGGPFENLVPTCDDCLFGKVDGTGFDIGFDFTFFGNTYKEFWISTNGFIAFEPVDNGCCEGNPIPFADDQINNIIALLWSDLNVERGQVGFETRGTAPNRRLVVDFSNVMTYDAPDHMVSAQLILHEGTNHIEMHTASLPTPTTYRYTQGIENALGSDAAFVPGRVNALFGLSNDAVRFAPPGGNSAPSVSAGGNAGGPPADRYEGREGATITFKAVGSDVDNDALSYSWDFDGNGVVDAQGAEVSHAYPDNGIYTARVTASDPHGLSATASVEVRVENVAPAAELKAVDVVDEGNPIVISVGDVVDPSSVDRESGFEFAFDCGDGFSTYSAVSSISCATVDNEKRTVKMKVRDRDGGESLATKSIDVRNVSPLVEAPATVTAKSGELVSLVGRFSDVGVKDWLWKWSWNPSTQGLAVEHRQARSGGNSSEQGTITGEYRACGAGPQKVTLVVEDKDGARGEATVTVNVEAQNAAMRVKPAVIALSTRDRDEDSDSDNEDRYSDDHGRIVSVYLYSSSTFDATAIDPASVRLTNGTGKGTPLAVKKNRRKKEWDMKVAHLNGDRLRDLKLRFNRSALIANGDLTASTTNLSLVVSGTCAGATASAPVTVRSW